MARKNRDGEEPSAAHDDADLVTSKFSSFHAARPLEPRRHRLSDPSPLAAARLAGLNEEGLQRVGRDSVTLIEGTFGAGLRKSKGTLALYDFLTKSGELAVRGRLLAPIEGVQREHPAFGDSNSQVDQYADGVLAQFDLPRPARPGFFWDDQARQLQWSTAPEAPPPHIDRARPFTSFTDPRLGDEFVMKFLDAAEFRNLDPIRVLEAVFASAWLSTRGDRTRLEDELISEWSGYTRGAGEPEAAFWGMRNDFMDSVFDVAISHGERLGAIRAEWQLTLLQGDLVINEFKKRRGASDSAVNNTNRSRRDRATLWQGIALDFALKGTGSASKIARDARREIVKTYPEQFRRRQIEIETIARYVRTVRKNSPDFGSS